MSVSDGQRVNASVTNAAYVSRTTDSDTVGVVGLNNASSGGLIPNAQQQINDNTTDIATNQTDIANLQTTKTDKATLTTKADIYVRDASAVTRLGVGSDNQVLVADSAESTGLKWDDAPGSQLTTKGDVLTRDGSSLQRLGVGADGQVLTANSAEATGLEWTTVSGGGNPNVVTKSGTATLLLTEQIVLADSSGGAFTLTLPTAVGNTGFTYRIKKTTSDFDAITIDGDGAETIDGNATTAIHTIGETLEIVSDGANWEIIRRTIRTLPVAYTPGPFSGIGTGTFNGEFYWSRIGKMMNVNGTVAVTAAFTGGTLGIPIPTGTAADFTLVPTTTSISNIGTTSVFGPTGITQYDNVPTHLFNTTVDEMRFVKTNSGSFLQGTDFGIGDEIHIGNLMFPIDGWNG